MKLNYKMGVLLMLGLAAGCTSATEQQGLEEVANFYGGTVSFRKGTNITTESNKPQGKYLEIDLDSPTLGRRYSDLRMPASNCAYLVYSKLTPEEQKYYNYLKVNLKDSTESHSYTFLRPELEMAAAAGSDLNGLLINLQTEDREKILGSFNTDAVPAADRGKIQGFFGQIEKEIFPITDYTVQGNLPVKVAVRGKEVQLVRFYVSVAHTGGNRRMQFIINPDLQPDQPFLYGVSLLP